MEVHRDSFKRIECKISCGRFAIILDGIMKYILKRRVNIIWSRKSYSGNVGRIKSSRREAFEGTFETGS